MHLIIFDLDGTLIDSLRDLAESANEMLSTYGAGPRAIDEIAGMIGDGAKKLVERALASAGLDPGEREALDRYLAIYERRLLDSTRPYDGMIDVVAAAGRRSRLALLSNKPEALSRRLLDAFDLTRHFSWIVGGDSGFARKPDPSSLRFLMQTSGATPESTLFVGDSVVDAETARRAGVRLCLVDFGFARLPRTFAFAPGEFPAARAADVGNAIALFLGDGGEIGNR
jgi:phosphoglycolate phosphatase